MSSPVGYPQGNSLKMFTDGTYGAGDIPVGVTDKKLVPLYAIPSDGGVNILDPRDGTPLTPADLGWDVGGPGGGPGFDVIGWVTADQFGITGTGDEGVKLNNALSFCAGKIFVIPSGMTITSSITITPPSNMAIYGRGATLKSACPGLTDRLAQLNALSNVTIVGLKLDGDRANFPTHTEHRHNLAVLRCTNVKLIDVESYNAKGDGYYIGDDTTPSYRVRMSGCLGGNNYRNGVAITSAVNFRATDCYFWGQTGYHPQAGADIEPNTDNTLLNDIKFTNCAFVGNVGYGAMVSLRDAPTVRQGGVDFIGCSLDESVGDGTGFNGHGLRVHNGRGVKVLGGQVRGSAYRGVIVTGNNGSGITLQGVEISKNGRDGIGVGSGAVATNLTIVANQIRDNSASSPNTYDAIYLAGATNSVVSLNTITGVSQRYGIRVDAGTSGIKAVHNEFGDLGSGKISDTVGDAIWVIDKDATLALSRAAAGDIAISVKVNGDTQPRLSVRADGDMRFGDGATTPDVRLYRSAIDTLRTNDSLTVDQILTVAKTIINTAADGTGYIEMREQSSDPAAPVANQARIFFKDNGSSKTQLCVRFATGAVQVLATEP